MRIYDLSKDDCPASIRRYRFADDKLEVYRVSMAWQGGSTLISGNESELATIFLSFSSRPGDNGLFVTCCPGGVDDFGDWQQPATYEWQREVYIELSKAERMLADAMLAPFAWHPENDTE